MLTKRERVHATISRRGLDAIPWQFDLTSAVCARLAGRLGPAWRDALDDHIAWVGMHAAPRPGPELPPEHVRDEFGVVWHRGARDYAVGDWGGVAAHPLAGPSLTGYAFPDGAAPGRWSHVHEVRAACPDRFLVAGGCGLFEAGWALCGFERYLEYVAGEPRFVAELTERLADFSCAVTRQLAETAGPGVVDGIRFGDDWGFQHTLMVRSATWRRLFKEPYRRIYGAARDAGLVVMIHSCGCITDVLSDLIEIGVQVVHPLQPEAMDVEFCRREYGRDLTFWGGLGSQSTLPHGTRDDVRREVRERLRQFHGGGYILAPAGAAPAETPAENILAIVEEARAQL